MDGNTLLKWFDFRQNKVAGALLFLLVLLLLPIAIHFLGASVESYLLNILILCMYWAALVSSWNLVSGYLGIFSMAHQVFFGIGAYASAMANLYLGMSPWLGLVFGGLCAGAISIVVAVPCLRLKAAPYIIIATMCLAEIVRLVFTNLVDWTRGELGFWEIGPYENVLGINFSGLSKLPYYYLILVLMVLVVGVCVFIVKSHTGLAMEAIRESPEAAEALGVDITRTKIKVFIISAVCAGVIGSFYAHYMKILTPTAMFGPEVMTGVIAMNLLGGTGTIAGPVFGAFFLMLCMETLRALSNYKLLIYAAILIIVMIFLPSGIMNSKGEFFRIGKALKQLSAKPKS